MSAIKSPSSAFSPSRRVAYASDNDVYVQEVMSDEENGEKIEEVVVTPARPQPPPGPMTLHLINPQLSMISSSDFNASAATLLSARPSTRDADWYGNNMLHHAFANNEVDLDIVRSIISECPELCSKYNQFGRLPMHYALDRIKVSLPGLRLLCDTYSEAVLFPDNEGLTPYDLALHWKHSKAILWMLLEKHPDLDRRRFYRLKYGLLGGAIIGLVSAVTYRRPSRVQLAAHYSGALGSSSSALGSSSSAVTTAGGNNNSDRTDILHATNGNNIRPRTSSATPRSQQSLLDRENSADRHKSFGSSTKPSSFNGLVLASQSEPGPAPELRPSPELFAAEEGERERKDAVKKNPAEDHVPNLRLSVKSGNNSNKNLI